MAFWLVKEEPDHYPFAEFRAEGRTAWTGVRNHQARNHLRSMVEGDAVIYYHTGRERAAVGLARVAGAAYPDPTAAAGDWSCVDLEAGEPLPRPVPLAEIKADPVLAGSALVRQGRLSVVPLTAAEYRRILALAGARRR
ncbi:MAG: EVE domain-containing protein [Planctomycetota bacterium]|nr:MAG: EVE domain-containing protein [Planctomycetota bacterium]